MKSVFASAFAYRSLDHLAVLGRPGQDDLLPGRTLISASQNFHIRLPVAPKQRELKLHGTIDLSHVYSAFFARDTAQNVFNPISDVFETRDPKEMVDTFVVISTTPDSVAMVDTKKNEVAIAIAGTNAFKLFSTLNNSSTFLRPLDISRARIMLRRHLKDFGLSVADMPLPTLPPRIPVEMTPQMHAAEQERSVQHQLL